MTAAPRRWRGALAAAGIAITGCGGEDRELVGYAREPAPEVADVALPDVAEDGREFAFRAPAEGLLVVYFGYTNCPDVCSLVMADMASALTRLSPQVAGDVQLLFVTTDPARDTPDVVGEYVDRFHPAFEGLTGPLPRIKAAAEPLGVAIQGTNRLPSGGYEVGHGSQIIGFTDDDKARVVWTEGTPVDDLVSDIHALAERSG